MAGRDLYAEVADRLAQDNCEVLAGRMSPSAFRHSWARRARSGWDMGGDRQTLTAHGMIVASLDRHCDGLNVPASWWRTIMPPETVLKAWADDGPLREVLKDYVYGPDFLGSAGEITFKSNVIIVGDAYRQALDAIEPLIEPSAWNTSETVERLAAARAAFELANAAHRAQARAPIEDRRDFADRVRGFFRPRTVVGTSYEGINAAHEADVSIMDCVLGTEDHRYRLYLSQAVRRHLLAGDRQRFNARLAEGSLRAALSERLGVRDVLVDPIDLTAAPVLARAAVAAFADALKAHAAVSNAHRGVIRAVLEQRQEEPEIPRGINVHVGSGGRPHDETDALRHMRQSASRQLIDRLPRRRGEQDHRQNRSEGA